MYRYITQGTCSREIDFEIEDGTLRSVRFIGGCRGNTQGIGRLVEGRNIDEVETLLRGVPCRGETSCPDQLSRAITAYKAGKLKEQ